MDRDIVLAAIWIKFRLGILVQIEGDALQSSLGRFRCARSAEDDLIVSGPGFEEIISGKRVNLAKALIEFSIEHGDSVVSLPRELREERIREISKNFQTTPELTKVVLSWAHTISG